MNDRIEHKSNGLTWNIGGTSYTDRDFSAVEFLISSEPVRSQPPNDRPTMSEDFSDCVVGSFARLGYGALIGGGIKAMAASQADMNYLSSLGAGVMVVVLMETLYRFTRRYPNNNLSTNVR